MHVPHTTHNTKQRLPIGSPFPSPTSQSARKFAFLEGLYYNHPIPGKEAFQRGVLMNNNISMECPHPHHVWQAGRVQLTRRIQLS